MSSPQFARIPLEIRAYRQFVLWRLERREGASKPTKVPYSPMRGTLASVTNPTTWASYDEAVAAFDAGGFDGIGFVFTRDDPFAGIDLDDSEGDHETKLCQEAVFENFVSYAELSPSGRGLHIIIKGSIPHGRRRAKIEAYSSERFFTMTGDVYRDAPIADCQALLNVLWAEMASGTSANFDASPQYVEAVESDEAVYRRAADAANGDKFVRLWNGDPSDLSDDTSGSAVDMALVDILAFYSKDPAQIERLWLASPQGQREKTQNRIDYRRSTINRAFDREVIPQNFDWLRDQLKAVADQGRVKPYGPTPPPSDPLPIRYATSFANSFPALRPWHVPDIIPGRTVTLLAGDGGTGKSLLALQLAVATASERSWLGSMVRHGPAMFLTAEDDLDEVHRRLRDVTTGEGIGFDQLHGLAVSSLAGLDALLALPDRRRGVLAPTPLFGALRAFVAAHRPALIVLDTLADLFGGEENDRAQARQFITLLRGLAIEFDVAVLLLAHPSLSGMNSGSGMSGSTAWNNSVRSRLYLRRDEVDPSARILEIKKSNYGSTGQQVRLEWQRGAFVEVGRTSQEPAHRAAAQSAADELFLRLLAEFASQGRTVSPHRSSRSNAAHLFAQTSAGREFKRSGFEAAMNRLFEANRIRVEERGPASKRKEVIVAVEHIASEPFSPPSERVPTGSDPHAEPPSDPPSDLFRPPSFSPPIPP